MPYELSVFHLPCGARAARVRNIGTLLGTEAESMMKEWAPGGPMFGLPALVLNQDLKVMTTEARAVFSRWPDPQPTEWFAIVGVNPVVRIAGNFIMRVGGVKQRRLFATEEEAIRWLDERARQSAAR
jgi:hypothetical protein